MVRCEICSKLIIKTPGRRQWRHSGVFIVNFEHIVLVFLVHIVLCSSVFIANFKHVIAVWADCGLMRIDELANKKLMEFVTVTKNPSFFCVGVIYGVGLFSIWQATPFARGFSINLSNLRKCTFILSSLFVLKISPNIFSKLMEHNFEDHSERLLD